jgi:hypothetical protein
MFAFAVWNYLPFSKDMAGNLGQEDLEGKLAFAARGGTYRLIEILCIAPERCASKLSANDQLTRGERR